MGGRLLFFPLDSNSSRASGDVRRGIDVSERFSPCSDPPPLPAPVGWPLNGRTEVIDTLAKKPTLGWGRSFVPAPKGVDKATAGDG